MPDRLPIFYTIRKREGSVYNSIPFFCSLDNFILFSYDYCLLTRCSWYPVADGSLYKFYSLKQANPTKKFQTFSVNISVDSKRSLDHTASNEPTAPKYTERIQFAWRPEQNDELKLTIPNPARMLCVCVCACAQ